MIIKEYYVNQDVDRALRDTELSLDELESIVGRFKPHSSRKGQLRGKISIQADYSVLIRHHFTGKVLWTNQSC